MEVSAPPPPIDEMLELTVERKKRKEPSMFEEIKERDTVAFPRSDCSEEKDTTYISYSEKTQTNT